MGKKKNTAIEAFDETDFSDSAPAFLPDGTHVSARSEGEPRVEYAPLAELEQASWPGNPKAHDIDTIVASIERFGFVSPMLMDEKSQRIVAGHGRVEALSHMYATGEGVPPKGIRSGPGGWFVPVLRGVDFESEQEAEAYLLADNRLQELGGWDNKRLVEMLGHVENWDGTGYTEDDLTSLLMSLNTAPLGPGEMAADDDFDPDTVLSKQTVSRAGDVWWLGRHALLCGDCRTDLGSVAAPGSVDLLVTDPPYGVSYAAKNEFLNAVALGNRIQTPIEGDHESLDDMRALWLAAFSAVRERMAPGAAYYCTGPSGDLLLALLLALRDAGFPLRHMLVWAKNNHVLGRVDYHYKHEPILYGWVDGAAHHAVANRSETTLWEIPRPQKSDLHPTMKPVELYARAMRNSSAPGAVVLDPFAGSGTVVIAAEQEGRTAVMVERAPEYCDVIVERWQSLTGKTAQRSA